MGAEKGRKREESGWKPRSGNRNSGRRQVALVEGEVLRNEVQVPKAKKGQGTQGF